jgi:hypothetical protein
MSGIGGRVGLLVLAFAIAVAVAGPSVVRAANPTATPGPAGDTRSAGEGPGLVGAPGLAILGVLALGLGTVVLTLVYVRASERGRRET